MVEVRKASKQKNKRTQKLTKAAATTPMTETSQQLMEKYSKLVSKKTSFGKRNSWYTLKFNVLKECTAARYYVVIMEFSNDDEGGAQQLINLGRRAMELTIQMRQDEEQKQL